MPKPDSTQSNSTQPEKQANAAQANAVQANTAQAPNPATNPDHKQLPDTPPLGLWGFGLAEPALPPTVLGFRIHHFALHRSGRVPVAVHLCGPDGGKPA